MCEREGKTERGEEEHVAVGGQEGERVFIQAEQEHGSFQPRESGGREGVTDGQQTRRGLHRPDLWTFMLSNTPAGRQLSDQSETKAACGEEALVNQSSDVRTAWTAWTAWTAGHSLTGAWISGFLLLFWTLALNAGL